MKKAYAFNENWFFQKKDVLEKFLTPWKGKPAVNYLEVGTWEGMSLIWMLENILTAESCMSVAIDPFELFVPDFKQQKNVFLKNLSVSGLERKVKFYQSFSENILSQLEKKFFDIIYLDGDLRAESLLSNLNAAKDLLSKNGILIINGYLWKGSNSEEEPKVVIDQWLGKNQDLNIIFREYYLVLKFKN